MAKGKTLPTRIEDMNEKELSLHEFIVNNLDAKDQHDVKSVTLTRDAARVTFKSGGGDMCLMWDEDEGWEYAKKVHS